MPIAIRQLHPSSPARSRASTSRRPLAPEDVAAIEAGMDRYAVLVFRGQRLTDEQQVAFSRNFGEIELAVGSNMTSRRTGASPVELRHLEPRRQRRSRATTASACSISATGSGTPTARSGRSRPSTRCCRRAPCRPAAAIPSSPTCAPPTTRSTTTTKAEIEDLVCEHSLMYSRGPLGFTDFTDEEKRAFAPVRQRLVRTHPVTGRRSLYLSSHAGTIVGWPMPEARALLRDLIEHATQREFVHAHNWRVDDLVMWDNRQTMHRARRYDETQARDMRRTTIAGDAPTVAQQAAE